MKLSKRCDYALRALIDLGIAQKHRGDVVSIGELAAHQEIPIKFLEQILLQIRRLGYVKSVRGKKGGYTLAKPMNEIIIGDVVRAVDGPLAPIRCVSKTAYERCSCPDEEHCGLRMLMLEVRNAVSDILDGSTLEDIVHTTIKKLKRDKRSLPFAMPR